MTVRNKNKLLGCDSQNASNAFEIFINFFNVLMFLQNKFTSQYNRLPFGHHQNFKAKHFINIHVNMLKNQLISSFESIHIFYKT